MSGFVEKTVACDFNIMIHVNKNSRKRKKKKER